MNRCLSPPVRTNADRKVDLSARSHAATRSAAQKRSSSSVDSNSVCCQQIVGSAGIT
ncbi:Uncharacterised protein [Mycobacteroides abscessus subsp. abscessus]|nr:Uncharacterised protein [Mycobacteroides abscessus subsp. abscessus]